MRKELNEALCGKYPEIFQNRHGDMTTTAMCWGFDCGDGWYNIIDAFCQLTQSRITQTNTHREVCKKKVEEGMMGADLMPDEVPQVVATQVKEKFGGLRFYYNGGDDVIDGFGMMAEFMSTRTCETCGAPGKLRGGGWMYTACDEHTKPEDKEDEG